MLVMDGMFLFKTVLGCSFIFTFVVLDSCMFVGHWLKSSFAFDELKTHGRYCNPTQEKFIEFDKLAPKES